MSNALPISFTHNHFVMCARAGLEPHRTIVVERMCLPVFSFKERARIIRKTWEKKKTPSEFRRLKKIWKDGERQIRLVCTRKRNIEIDFQVWC